MLLSADQRGRVALHTFSTMLLRTSASSRALVEGSYGPVLGVQHLTPFVSNQPMAGSTASGADDAGARASAVLPQPCTASYEAGHAARAWGHAQLAANSGCAHVPARAWQLQHPHPPFPAPLQVGASSLTTRLRAWATASRPSARPALCWWRASSRALESCCWCTASPGRRRCLAARCPARRGCRTTGGSRPSCTPPAS
jgi:hypothetical protein